MIKCRVVAVKKIKLIVAAVLIVVISLSTYMYFKKQPVENVPNRATLVMNTYYYMGNGV